MSASFLRVQSSSNPDVGEVALMNWISLRFDRPQGVMFEHVCVACLEFENARFDNVV